jgi:hypothetical protein
VTRIVWEVLLFADRLAQLARDRHRLQRGVDDLGRPRFLRRVLRLRLEQLGVREDHAELVIELMQQLFRIERHGVHLRSRVIRGVLRAVRLTP